MDGQIDTDTDIGYISSKLVDRINQATSFKKLQLP